VKLFNYIINKRVNAVVITYKGRLTRFGFEYLEHPFKQFGVKIEAVYGEEPRDAHQELVEDLLAIVTSFADKLYGLSRRKRLVEEFKKLLEEVERGG